MTQNNTNETKRRTVNAAGGDRKAPALTPEERRLFARVAAGDREAEQEIARRNLPLVKTVARGYRTGGADFEDLVQEGCLGLLKAIRKFQPAKGFKFSTYAHWWIRQAISRFVKGPTRLIRLPEYVHDEISQLHRARESTQMETGVEPNEKELEHDLSWKAGRVNWLDRLKTDASSLDARVRDGQGLAVSSGIAADTEDPQEVASRRVAWREVVGEMKNLPARQAKILAYRYGLGDGRRRSLAWVGKRVGLSPERVRQLEKRALATLRAA